MQTQTPQSATGKRQGGFTIIELLVTVTILAILIAIATPSMSSFVAEWRVNAAINTLSRDVRLAKAEAIKRSRPVILCPANAAGTGCDTGKSWSNGWMAFIDDNYNDAYNDGTDELILQQAKLPGVGKFEHGVSSVKLKFVAQGLLQTPPSGNFVIESSLGGANPKVQCTVNVARTARLNKVKNPPKCK